MSTSALASEISSITQNAPIKYAVDSISAPDTQQTAYDILAPGGQVAVFNPIAAKATKEKDIFFVFGGIRHPPNIKLLETFYHDNLEKFLKEGAIKVSHTTAIIPISCSLIECDSQTKLKYCRVLREYRTGWNA